MAARPCLAALFLGCIAILGTEKAAGQPSLEGVWLADWINDTPGYYRQFSRHFTGTGMIATTKTVIDNPAQGFYAMDIEMHYHYRLGEALAGFELPTYVFDLVAQRVVLIPQSVSAAGFFRNVSECGLNQWQVGVPVEVTGLLCQQTGPDYPWFRTGENRSYEIIGFGEEYLRAALLEDDARYNGTSPETRARGFSAFMFRRTGN